MLTNHGRASRVGGNVIKITRACGRVVTRGRPGEALVRVEELDAFHLVEALVSIAFVLCRVPVGTILMQVFPIAQLCGRVSYHRARQVDLTR